MPRGFVSHERESYFMKEDKKIYILADGTVITEAEREDMLGR